MNVVFASTTRSDVEALVQMRTDANRFYQRHGFAKTAETEWDIYYVRKPQ